MLIILQEKLKLMIIIRQTMFKKQIEILKEIEKWKQKKCHKLKQNLKNLTKMTIKIS